MPAAAELFKCPACGAALAIPSGQRFMKCTYCRSSVIVPGAEGTATEGAEALAAGMDKVMQLATAGNKIIAIKLFRQMTQAGLAECKRAVDAIARGQAVDLSRYNASPAAIREALDTFAAEGVPSRGRRSGCMVALAFILLIAGIAAVFLLQRPAKSGDVGGSIAPRKPALSPVPAPAPRPFADPLLAFGQKGTGPGMLNDPRYVGADRDGNIYAGDYMDGRINVFDPAGRFLRQVNLGDKTILRGMAVAPDGTIYLSYQGRIHRLDSRGGDRRLDGRDKKGRPFYFDHIVLAAGGSLVAACQGERIVRFGANGAVNLVIERAFSGITGDTELNLQLAVDGLGNIYALGTFNNRVLKYGPNGRFIDQFGGRTEHPAQGVDEGRFQAPDAIAVDGHGRVFVSDIWGVQAFDANGRFQKYFKVDGVAFGMAFDLDNNLLVASNKPAIIKLRIQNP